jgi:hypothetical protein
VVISSARITLSAGNAFEIALASGLVFVNSSADPARPIGADAEHRPYLYTPDPVVSGSSLSHWDPLTSPNLLMEPSISVDLDHRVDLTSALLEDIGWRRAGGVGAASVPVGPAVWLWFSAAGFVGAALLALRRRPA